MYIMKSCQSELMGSNSVRKPNWISGKCMSDQRNLTMNRPTIRKWVNTLFKKWVLILRRLEHY